MVAHEIRFESLVDIYNSADSEFEALYSIAAVGRVSVQAARLFQMHLAYSAVSQV